jgi:UDP-GlcNAc:undecaprenyl-phosphate GlcNAc-1-phosphate transferase
MRKFEEIFILAFLVAVGLTPVFRWIAFRLGVLDHPKGHGIHTHPVPRLGGAALYLAFVAGSLYRMDLSEALKGVLVGSTLIFITGLVDDLIRLRASLRLAIQLFACGLMMFRYGVILDLFPNLFLNAFFTTLGIIGITNAVNFLDNMDGLAAGLVMISSGAIAVVAHTTRQPWLGYLSVALVGATAGFLVFNLRKAYVFMGDSGSTFLGFTLSSLAVMTEWSYYWPVTFSASLLILGIPILDMILITVLRVKEEKVRSLKQWIDYAGKDHLSHRLMRLGLGQRGSVFTLWGFQALFCLAALTILPRGFWAGITGLLLCLLITVVTIFLFWNKRTLLLQWKGRTPQLSYAKRIR